MTTGSDLFKFIRDGIDQSYTSFLNSARANRLIRDSEIKVAEKHYLTNRTQKTVDELSPLTVLDGAFQIRNNYFRTRPLPVTGLTIVGLTVTITTGEDHQLQVGDTFTLTDSAGFTPSINGTYTVLAVNSSTQYTATVPATVGTWTAGTGDVTHTRMIPNILHPLAIRTTFVSQSDLEITAVNTTATPPYISFARKTLVRTGSRIRISGALGVTGLNGDFYCKMRGRNSFFIYTDEALTIPATLSGVYQGSGSADILVSEYSTRLHSDRRIAPSSDADIWSPKFGISDNSIRLYPTNKVCEDILIDYMKMPPITIDVANTSIDLEDYYNFKYLMAIKDQSVQSFMLEMRELEQYQAETIDNRSNS